MFFPKKGPKNPKNPKFRKTGKNGYSFALDQISQNSTK